MRAAQYKAIKRLIRGERDMAAALRSLLTYVFKAEQQQQDQA